MESNNVSKRKKLTHSSAMREAAASELPRNVRQTRADISTIARSEEFEVGLSAAPLSESKTDVTQFNFCLFVLLFYYFKNDFLQELLHQPPDFPILFHR